MLSRLNYITIVVLISIVAVFLIKKIVIVQKINKILQGLVALSYVYK